MNKQTCVAILAMLVAALIVICFCISMVGKPHRDYLSFVEELRKTKASPEETRVVLSSAGGAAGGARFVIIEDSRMISRLFDIFHDSPIVRVAEYTDYSGAIFPDGTDHESFTLDVTEGKKRVVGPLYVGGRKDVGIGFLIEQSQDNHWFHGAWDPWPKDAYWFNMFDPKWGDEIHTGIALAEDDQWRYEAFSFLFFLKQNVGGVELRLSNGEWKYRLLGDRSEPEREELAELVKLNSIGEFYRRHPNFKRTLVRSDRVPLTK